jgi:hypothetical protein
MDPAFAAWFGACDAKIYLFAACGHKNAALGKERGEATESDLQKRAQAALALLAFMRR